MNDLDRSATSLLQRAKKIGNKFQNPVPVTIGGPRMMLKLLPEFLTNKAETEPKAPLGPFTTDDSVYSTEPASGLRVTWFGHSEMLLEMGGVRVLIDPVWEQRASPFQFMGPKRFFPPTLPLEQLPRLDAVLISHDHYDHLGAHTVRKLAKLQPQARWVTSLAVGKLLQGFGVAAERITELDWTESTEVAGLKLTAWPARHFSGRGLHNRFSTLWSSFVLECPMSANGEQRRVYYGADSGFWDGFAEIAAQYPGFDLVMLEIGAFSPHWADIHLGPDNAVTAFESMGGSANGTMLMPIHWGLFNLALHGWRQPMERLTELAAERELRLWSPRPGEPTEVVPGEALWSSWWKKIS
jgi:L-ascorbate metabolism protein UlaG (beta-lactamase superfamily)